MDSTSTSSAPIFIALAFFAIFMVFAIIVGWKLFEKAGKPGWAAIVPIYNYIVLLEICGRPLWWILLLMLPIVNFVIVVILCIDFAKCFGKGTGYGIAFVFFSPILAPILAFGDAKYTPIQVAA